MEFGAHLPLISFQGETRSLVDLLDYAATAEGLGYRYLCANDHFVFSTPWLDGPTALASVLARAPTIRLATTVTIPVVRGLVQTAKTLAAIDLLSGGRLTVGVGPGSSAADYAAAGVDFGERWKRLDEIVPALRALWTEGGGETVGRWYDTRGLVLRPAPAQQPAPPIWVGSWGSQAGLRRVARIADGWLASGYNTTPATFAEGLSRLTESLEQQGRDAASFPNGIATMWLYVTEDREEADRWLSDVLAPSLRRPEAELRERLPIGSPESCARKLAAYAAAGAQRIFLWPLADERRQLERFRGEVLPLVLALSDRPKRARHRE